MVWSTEFESTAQQAETVRPFPAPPLPRFEQHGRIIVSAKMKLQVRRIDTKRMVYRTEQQCAGSIELVVFRDWVERVTASNVTLRDPSHRPLFGQWSVSG